VPACLVFQVALVVGYLVARYIASWWNNRRKGEDKKKGEKGDDAQQ
jgi:hypothetical protein